jgi:phage shock protein E
MKYYITISFILLISCSLTAQVPDSLKVKSLPPAEFQSAYLASGNALLFDVREYFEYKKSRIKNAINLPSSANMETETDTISKQQDLFFYCTTGFRSKRVAKYFFEKGFTNLYSLDGGINAWKKEKMEVDKKRIRKK